MRISAEDLRCHSGVFTLGDIHYHSSAGVTFDKLRANALEVKSKGFLPKEVPDGHVIILELERQYNDHCVDKRVGFGRRTDVTQEGSEPEWVQLLEPEVQSYLRVRFLQDAIDPLAIVGALPYAGFSYLIEEGGLCHDVVNQLGLHRLHNVAQLGLLQNPVVGADEKQSVGTIYRHSRYVHSLDVCALITLMAYNNNLPESDRIHLQVAALTHDILTPAGGDSIKRYNATLFDEDVGYPAIFTREVWPALKEKYNLDEQKLADLIMGKGMLGRFLDLADKLAYVSRDVFYFIQSLPHRTPDGLSKEQAVIRDLVTRFPYICGLWESIEIVDGQVAISNPLGLANFLKLRATMFKALYYNPSARFHEDVTAKLFAGYLMREGSLTKAQLLHTTDAFLYHELGKVTGLAGVLDHCYSPFKPRVETFATVEEANRREQEFLGNKKMMTHLEVRKSFTSAGTASFLVRIGREVKPFKEVLPEDAADIEAIMAMPNPVWLYIFSIEDLKMPASLLKQLRFDRRQRLRKAKV